VLLDAALERNPGLLEAAIELHQRGDIPAGTHVIDLDALADNARAIVEASRRHAVRVLAVTKQSGHHPHAAAVVLEQGVEAITAVEAVQAHRLHRYGFPLGVVGHTSQLPRHQVEAIVCMRPRAVTVYSVEAARAVSAAAARLGVVQPLYVCVANPDDAGLNDELFGGWSERKCVDGVRRIAALPAVQVAGLAQHVTIDYGANADPRQARPTEAFFTTVRARETLERELGLSGLALNCAGNCNAVTVDVLARYGATEIEPGLALIGCARFHALGEMPERPAQVFVSEITHHWRDHAYGVGGGFSFVWGLPGSTSPIAGLAGRDLTAARKCRLPFAGQPWYEMHGRFHDPDVRAQVGDTLLFVHHAQANMERGYVAAVSGIASGTPRVEALCDACSTVLDDTLAPVPFGDALAGVRRIGRRYLPSERRP
jgi:predicted amino acid racemase